MDTHYNYHAPKIVTIEELATRRDEFDVPAGAVAALQAGSAPVIVFLRATGEEYQLAAEHETHCARTTLGLTARRDDDDDCR